MIYDVVGVGFGPSNIALAIAMKESGYPGRVLFLERNPDSLWHPDMLLDGSDIQNNLLRDLITPTNPCSRYSFVNYLHQSGRFFHYLNLGRIYPLRKDFFDYIRWVARQFDNVEYSTGVSEISVTHGGGGPLWRVTTSDGARYLTRTVVMGTGRRLNVPSGLEESASIVHLVNYLPALQRVDQDAPVGVLGASQSAVEILLDLLGKKYRNIVSIHRSFSFRLKDTSPFSDEVYFPEFIDYYHGLPPAKRAQLDRQVRQTNYSCADRDILEALYTRMYEDTLDGRRRVTILRNHEVAQTVSNEPLVLVCKDVYTGASQTLELKLLILATGFLDVGRNGRAGLPALLADHAGLFSWNAEYLDVERDYRVRYVDIGEPLPDLYLNGLCESSHGMGDAGSFSLVSVRAREIVTSLAARRSSDESGFHDVRHIEEAVRARRGSGIR